MRSIWAVLLAAGGPVTAPQDVCTSVDRAAQDAAAYWQGRRVRAAEEPYLPVPVIGPNGSINYHGESSVQECLEYYVDKRLEEGVSRRMLQREEEIEKWRGNGASRAGPNNQVAGIMVYLLMENAARTVHQDLLLSLLCLAKFFDRYPVVVFHTNASRSSELARLRASVSMRLRLTLEEVHLDFPLSISGVQGGPDAFLAPPHCQMDGRHWWLSHRSCGCRCPAWRPQCWPLNWMHATRFFTAGMFRTKTFRQGSFDFFLRLDTDLFLIKIPSVDPLELMVDRGCALVYDRISREAPGCFDGFDERTVAFLDSLGYVGQPDSGILHVGRGPAAVGGQWTAGDARLFRSDEYLHFADFAASGIYSNRWADQLFLARGLALFGPAARFSGLAALEGSGRMRYPLPQWPHWANASVCVRSMFGGGNDEGFVHQKGGFRHVGLLQRCSAAASFPIH